MFLEGKKHERHLWVTNEGPVGDEKNSWEDKGLSETFAERFGLDGVWLVEELGLAGINADHLGLAGEKGDQCWGWAAVSHVLGQASDKSRGTFGRLGASFSLWEVNGRGLVRCFQCWIRFLAAFMKGEKGQM